MAGQISPTNNLATVAGDTTILNRLSQLSTQLGLLGTSDVVSDMNALANITSDISRFSRHQNRHIPLQLVVEYLY